MPFETFYATLIDVFSKNDCLPTPTKEQVQKLYELTEIMLEVNKSMNLTAITEEKAVVLKHYADSLTVSSLIPEGANVADIGCGAGFPTLPLGIFRPDLKITAVDSTTKRIDYVNATAKKLDLDNVTAISARAEDLGNNAEFRESFDIVTARAVANLPVLTELCLPLVKIGGNFIAMKARLAEDELSAARNAIKVCGGVPEKELPIDLTADDESFEKRILISIKKASSTPKNFPRHYSKISKKPL